MQIIPRDGLPGPRPHRGRVCLPRCTPRLRGETEDPNGAVWTGDEKVGEPGPWPRLASSRKPAPQHKRLCESEVSYCIPADSPRGEQKNPVPAKPRPREPAPRMRLRSWQWPRARPRPLESRALPSHAPGRAQAQAQGCASWEPGFGEDAWALT